MPEADSDIHLFVIYSHRFKPPEKMYVRFNSNEAIIALWVVVRGMMMPRIWVWTGGGMSVDALMTMQGVFNSIIDKLRYVAKQDILTEFEEKKYEEHTEAEDEYYNKLYEEHVEHVIDHYLNHLGSAYAVKKKTSEEKRNEMYNVIELVNKTRMYHKAYSNPKVGCVTILCVMLDFWRDIDASIFLSVHGNLTFKETQIGL